MGGDFLGRDPGREEEVRLCGRKVVSPGVLRFWLCYSIYMVFGVGVVFEELFYDGMCDECEFDEVLGVEEVC